VAEPPFWHLLARPALAHGQAPDHARLAAWRAMAAKLARLVSPALAAHRLAPVEAALGERLIDPAKARASRLANRLTGHLQHEALKALLGTGITVCCLKGFAAAHTLYPDPDLRTFGDLDLLVPADALPRAIETFKALGFAFRPLAGKPWGFQSDASLPPLASADGRCNIDLHVHPDAFPAWRALPADAVFAQSRIVAARGLAIPVPSPTHVLVLAATNTAKDKMGPYGVRRMIDVFALLDLARDLDWQALEAIARARPLGRAIPAFLALADALGYPFARAAAGPPPAWLLRPPPGPGAGRAFAGVCAAWRALDPDMPGPFTAFAREAFLCWPPEVALDLNARRLAGLAGRVGLGGRAGIGRGEVNDVCRDWQR